MPKLQKFKYLNQNCRNSRGEKLNPVVVLTDFRKIKERKMDMVTSPCLSSTTETSKNLDPSRKTSTPLTEVAKPEMKALLLGDATPVMKKSNSFSPRYLTPPRSTPSPSLSAKDSSNNKKSTNKSSEEYEVEKIVGYHKDKENKMWYLIKWKGWSKDYNSFETIENLTNCNLLLMNHFESVKPTQSQIRAKKEQIVFSLSRHEFYKKMKKNGFTAEELLQFSENCVDLTELFSKNKLDSFEEKIRTEYEYIVRCLIGMSGDEDPGMFSRAQNYKICIKLIDLRRQQLKVNLKCEEEINRVEKVPITIENTVDLDTFPSDFCYVTESKIGRDVYVPKDPLLGCECEDSCSPMSNCCGKMAGSTFAYAKSGRLRFDCQVPIYECNRRCKCSESCRNRTVQRGRTVKLGIFKTAHCGWGVQALENIPTGSFVCEYVGEIISDSEAAIRDFEYFRQNISYLFDLDFCDDYEGEMYCIDAAKYGNIARFINHSCDPNLLVCPVWVDCLEPSLHRLAFFAKRRINKYEEINFDYGDVRDGVVENSDADKTLMNSIFRTVSKVQCQCKSTNCRQWILGYK